MLVGKGSFKEALLKDSEEVGSDSLASPSGGFKKLVIHEVDARLLMAIYLPRLYFEK